MSADARSLDTGKNNLIGHGAVQADAGPLSVRRRASFSEHGGIIFLLYPVSAVSAKNVKRKLKNIPYGGCHLGGFL